MRRALVVLVVALVLQAQAAVAMPPNPKEVAARDELRAILNDARAAHDPPLGALAPDDFMDREAYLHSKAMARDGALNHQGFGNRRSHIETNDPDLTVRCECVAQTTGSFGPDSAARRILKAWRTSQNKRCLFDRDAPANTVGIGIQKAGNSWYATLITAEDAAP